MKTVMLRRKSKKQASVIVVFVNVLIILLWMSVKGNDHLVMLTVSGELYTSGCGEQGQLGRVAEHFANRGGRKGLSMCLHVDQTAIICVPEFIEFSVLTSNLIPYFCV